MCISNSSSYTYTAGPNTVQADLSRALATEPESQDFGIIVHAEKIGVSELDKPTTPADATIGAHKLILAARSPVLRAMLSSGMKESCADEMEITGYAVDVVRAFVRFLYCDACDHATLDAHAWQLLALADKYDVPALRHVCETHLTEKLDAATAVTTLQRADLHGAGALKRKALEYIVQNKKAVLENPALLRELSADLLSEVVFAFANKE
jgi:speckle-type POZ protein